MSTTTRTKPRPSNTAAKGRPADNRPPSGPVNLTAAALVSHTPTVGETPKKGRRSAVVAGSPWLTIADACDYLSVPRSTLNQWRDEGRFTPAVWRMPNGRLLVHKEDLDAWVTAQKRVD